MMELLASALIGLLAGAGIWLVLKPRTFEAIIGFNLLSYAVNLFVFLMGRMVPGRPPIIDPERAPALGNYADPLPQALVLTAIVISLAMTAVLVALAVRGRAQQETDHVDGAANPARERGA